MAAHSQRGTRISQAGQVVLIGEVMWLAPFSEDIHRFVILGRSKERSDAAQTLGSMPRLQSAAAVPNSAPL
ncbi:MAG: hypothetical protein E5Y29_29210, partial [Mesorhizobium sp.]